MSLINELFAHMNNPMSQQEVYLPRCATCLFRYIDLQESTGTIREDIYWSKSYLSTQDCLGTNSYVDGGILISQSYQLNYVDAAGPNSHTSVISSLTLTAPHSNKAFLVLGDDSFLCNKFLIFSFIGTFIGTQLSNIGILRLCLLRGQGND